MMPACIPLRIVQGTTLNKVLRLMQPGRIYRDITSIAATAPVRITAPGHGIVGTWPAWFAGVVGLPNLNRDPASARPHMVKVIDQDTLEVNVIDASGAKPSAGRLIYLPPLDLEGVTGRLLVRPEIGAAPVLELTTANGGLVVDGLGLLRIHLSAAATASLGWTRANWDLELTFADGTVTRFAQGEVEVGLEGCP